MRRKPLFLTAAVLVIAAVPIAVMASATVRGASVAVLHFFRGRSALYSLGCVMGPSADPAEFRFEELVAQRYHLYCVVTGGIAPSIELVRFVDAYNATTIRLGGLRYGKNFLDRAYADAARDVVVRNVVLTGCYDRGDLKLPTGERVRVFTPVPFKTEVPSGPVTISGRLTEVRAGDWNRWHGRTLHSDRIDADPNKTCDGQPTPRSG